MSGFALCYPPLPPGTGCSTCSGPASAGQEPTSGPGAALPSCSGTRASSRSTWRCTRRAIQRVTPRRTVIPDLVRSLRPVILDLGLASDRELAELDAAVRRHLADPRTLMMPHLLMTAWGRKPPT